MTSSLLDPPISVLLIDDQPMIGEGIRRMLVDEEDIMFHFCRDPTKALTMAQYTKPTVILQDLVMPDMDGLTLVKFLIANNAPTQNVPLIVLSSREDPVIKAEAFNLGFPIGLDEEIAEFVAEKEIHLNLGDGVVLYTDGITEAENEVGEFYQLDRLCNVIQKNWHQSAQEIKDTIINNVRLHIG
jgi:PleD family two-component response regulator